MSLCVCDHQSWDHSVVEYPKYRRPCTVCLKCDGARVGKPCCLTPQLCRCADFDAATGHDAYSADVHPANAAATLVVCKWLRDKVKAWEEEAKATLALLQGERKAAVVGGQVIGHVTMAKGRTTARVADDAAMLAYVQAHHPTEVETVTQIRPAFLKHLLDGAAKKGAFVDADGVVVDGLAEVRTGDPYPMPKPSGDVDAAIVDMLSRGALGVHGLRELPG